MNEGQNAGRGFGGASNRMNFGVSNPQGGGLASNPQSFAPQPMAPVQTPISSGTGDIVLAPEKKSHKGVIIALVLAALIIGGLFAAVFLMRGGNSGTNGDAKTAFNKYANYLLYGEDSDKALEGEYDESNIYKLDEIRSEDAKAVTNYFKTANELLINFESLMGGNTNNDLATVINNYRADFELVRLTFTKEYISEDELINEVVDNELGAVKDWIANKYNNLTNSNYDSVKQYAEAEINYYQLYAEYLENLKTRGCFGGGNACDAGVDENLEAKMMEYRETALSIESDAVRGILNNCWTIEKLIDGETGA